MAARTTYYAENLTTGTTTNTAATDRLTLTVTAAQQVANADYLVMFTAVIGCRTNSTDYTKLFFRDDSAGTDLDQLQTVATGVWIPLRTHTMFFKFTAAATPVNQTWKIRWATSNAAKNAEIQEARILCLKLGTNDKTAFLTTNKTTTSTTYQNHSGLTFTPGSVGDYLVLSCAEKGADSSGNRGCQTRLLHSGTGYSEDQYRHNSVNDDKAWFGGAKLSALAASSQTLDVEYKSLDSGQTVHCANVGIVALRLDDFDNNYFDEDRAGATDSSGVLVDTNMSITQTPQAVEHLIIGGMSIGNQSANAKDRTKMIDGVPADIFNGTVSYQPSATDRWDNIATFHRRTETASSTTWKWLHGGDSGTSDYKEGWLMILQLGATVGGGPTTFPAAIATGL